MSFSIIAAIGKNRELGKDSNLLWSLPDDLKFFKKTTMGHPVLMGHKTFDSLPGILPGRKHYVLSRKTAEQLSSDALKGAHAGVWPDDQYDVTLISNLSKFVDEAPRDEEIFVIGGGMVYWEMLKFCDTLYLTEVDAEDKTADTFFPEFDKSEYHREILGKGEQNGLKYVFAKYTKLK